MLLPDAPPADWWIRRRGAVIRAHASEAELRCAAARTPTSRRRGAADFTVRAPSRRSAEGADSCVSVPALLLVFVYLFIYLDFFFFAPGRRWCLAELHAS